MMLHGINSPTNIAHDDSLSRPIKDISASDKVDVIIANPPFGGSVKDGILANFSKSYQTKETADLFLVLFLKLLKDQGRAGIVLPDGSLTGDGVKARIRAELLAECNLHTIIRLPNSVFAPYATVATNLLFFTKGSPTKEIWYYEHRLPEGQKAYSKTKPIDAKEFEEIKKWWNKRVESDVAWKVGIKEIEARNFDLDIKNPSKKEELQEFSSAELIKMLEDSFDETKKILAEIKKEF
jgi:type I restriction enzyme M protein